MVPRVRKPGWMLLSPYTNPCLPKKPRTMPPTSAALAHVFNPHDLIDPYYIAAYKAYKRNTTGETRDVDLPLPVGVTWFQRFQTNFMDLEESHMDAYLNILRKRQRAYPDVYTPRVNLLHTQFFSYLKIQWRQIFGPRVEGKPPTAWKMLEHKWPTEDLKMVRGIIPYGSRPWHEVDYVLIPCNLGREHWVLASLDLREGKIFLLDSFRQQVPWEHRLKQVACLRWFIPSMLHQIGFHDSRKADDTTYKLSKSAFRMSILDGRHGVPQQQQRYVIFKILFYPIRF
ncbi:hypothetical protein LWI29_038421 [Acer saccharum]|uniref:Ubiquitin-like protease family profile domain-containing protein n=1 Tax=Acer saccharum TaxID=4024 RepID=A0AA39SFR9_ACESA|nr:hypothetical protein LWI29_038421 [Acer saccharum]